MLGRSDTVINTGLSVLEKAARKSSIWWVRLVALQALDSLQNMYAEREKELNSKKATVSNSKNSDSTSVAFAANQAHAQYEKVNTLFESIKSQETDKNLLRYYSN